MSDRVDDNILRGKTVFVTGAHGFLGRNVFDRLVEAGARVIKNTTDLRFNTPPAALRPDLVIHLAADVSGISRNVRHPYRFLQDNTLITLNMIRVMREWEGAPLLAAGSICAYPDDAPLPFYEGDFWHGKPEQSNLGYGLAKRFLAGALECAGNEFGLRYGHLICANLYGPRDHFDDEAAHVIPSIISRMAAVMEKDGKVFTAWGTGKPTRDFLYVEDAADAYVVAAQHLLEGRKSFECNLGSGKEISIDETIRIIAREMDFEGIITYDAARPNGQSRRRVSITKAAEILAWKPMTPFHEGIHRTVQYYRGMKNIWRTSQS